MRTDEGSDVCSMRQPCGMCGELILYQHEHAMTHRLHEASKTRLALATVFKGTYPENALHVRIGYFLVSVRGMCIFFAGVIFFGAVVFVFSGL